MIIRDYGLRKCVYLYLLCGFICVCVGGVVQVGVSVTLP